MTIGVLITNYNSWPIAMQCIDAHLLHSAQFIQKIVLVDDCSTEKYEGSIDSRVTVIRNEQNLGFVKSVNTGFKNLDTDIIVLFDADAYPLSNYAPSVIKDFSLDPSLSIIGFTTYGKDGGISGSSENVPGAASLILGQQLYHWYQQHTVTDPQNLVVYSCAMAIRKKALDAVGGFDENFDWLDPDHDLCMSLKEKGWKIKYSKEIKAFHEGGGTPQIVSHRVLRFYKNRWYLLRKHGKINKPMFVKRLILLRLRVEYLLLKIAGKLYYKDHLTYEDKLSGRKNIIEYCKMNYK